LAAVKFGTAGYERSLSFTLFRLLGPSASRRLFPPGTVRARWIDRIRFYIDLGDVMLIIARSATGGVTS
jgi:hypothetical protein